MSNRLPLILTSLLMLCIVISRAPGQAVEAKPGAALYVSPQGNDAWSGKLPAANAAKTDGPLASLETARDRIRAMKKAGPLPNGGVAVYLRAGEYFLPQTFKLEAQDSGTAAAPVIYRNYENEKATLIGGKAVTGFVPYKGSILQADLAGQGLKGAAFKQLFFDGKRQHLARYPNFDANNPYGGGWAYVDGNLVQMYKDIPDESKKTLVYKADDARTWSKPKEVEVFVFPRYNWWNNIIRVDSIDPATRTITLASNASYAMRPGDRYYFQNALEELDAPGEWYLDKSDSKLYFWPPSPLAGKTVAAPTMRTIVELAAGTANVTFRGLTFECCEGTAITFSTMTRREFSGSTSWGVYPHEIAGLVGTTNCLIAGCTIRNVGDYNGSGVAINGGERNGVVGCDIYETGSHGVAINGGDRKTLTPAGNYADNNYIHHVGVFYKQGVGISMNGCGNRASHNYIHDGPRMGIMFSGNNLVIEYNHIRHMNLETEDTGAVYTGGRDWISSRGTVVRYNYFHDMLGYGHDDKGVWHSPHFSWGVYLDDNTGGVDVIGNIVTRCSRACIHLHNGRDNLIENNIFVDGRLQQVEYSGWTINSHMWKDHFPTMVKGYEMVAGEPAWKNMRNMNVHPKDAPLPDGKIMTGNQFRRNIVFYDANMDDAALFRMSNVPFDRNEFDYNLYFHAGLPLRTGQAIVQAGNGPNLAPNPSFEDGQVGQMPKSWQWQAHPTGARAGVTRDVHCDGAQCLELENADGKDAKGKPQTPIIASADIPAKPGQAFKLTARMKADKPETQVSLSAQSYIANVYFWMKETAPKLGTDWQTVEVSFKMPAPGEKGYNEKMAALRVRLELRQPTGKIWIDDVRLVEGKAMDEWESWQAMGLDKHSLVADPLFVAADKNDFRLKADSPAYKLGFKPIPVDKIGPYRDPLRASWPIADAPGAREMPLQK